ncbi:MAG: hypothetical protein LUH09_03010 [Clostridiales bacterium]|nr:hypothetical protein [Clostridiales bacterium]
MMTDLTGQRFGNLTVVKATDQRENRRIVWECRCDCGNEVEHSCADLQQKNYISCGCLKRIAEERLKDRTTHVAGTQVEMLRDKKVRSDSSTGVTGVNMYRGRYRALIHFQGKRYNLGIYKTLEEAAAVRKKADADPKWGQENPVSISVSRTETGDFLILMKPELEKN